MKLNLRNTSKLKLALADQNCIVLLYCTTYCAHLLYLYYTQSPDIIKVSSTVPWFSWQNTISRLILVFQVSGNFVYLLCNILSLIWMCVTASAFVLLYFEIREFSALSSNFWKHFQLDCNFNIYTCSPRITRRCCICKRS